MVQAPTVSPPKVVRIIEPTIPIHETVKTTYRALRVAAYCRVSTKQEEQLHSYETQVKHYTERIQAENGWILEGIYADKGITGTSYKKRDEFNRMIRRCKQGKIDMIIVKSIARFARNTVDCLKFVRMLNDLNVVVYFEEQGIYSNQPGAEFYITIYGSIAQSESENISANVKWGKARSAKEGNVPFHYKNFLGYRKGADSKPEIDPEEAETIRFIYERFLAGDSLSGIAQKLNDLQVPTPSGKGLWQNSTIQSILSNEKYVGDVLMQKTFQQDCISRKTIRNTGQRTMYLVPDHHEAIIDRKTYNAVQTELARRNALKGNTQKSTSGRSCYTPKYALSDRLICGECGTLYRRCTWVNRGKKHIVWRCISRFDYGKKYCHDSPSVDEQQLQQTILRAINSIMSEKPALVRQVTENLQVVIRPNRSGELTIADIDHQLETLAREFDATFATAAIGNATDYSERFKMILTQQTELKAKRAELERQQAEDAELTSHMEEAADIMGQAGTAITEWDEYQIRALVESVRILSKDEILVRLKSGIEKIERLQK